MQKITFFSVATIMSFQLCQIANAQQADVYVDLTALDAISNSGYFDVSAPQPLFPVYQKSEKPKTEKTVKKAKPAAKKKKTPAKKAVVEVVKKKSETLATVAKPAEKIVVVDVEPSTKPQTHKEVIYAGVEEVKPVASTQPQAQEKIEIVAIEPVTEKPAPVKELTPSENTVAASDIPQSAPVAEVSASSVPVVAEPAVTSEPVVELNAPKPLIPAIVDETDIENKSTEIARIKFAAEVSELTEAQKTQLDAVINSFSNPSANKIAIYAYNLDDGVDSFKKKRLCLNRAVEVRSYLLQKGYKNFSIKVINVDGKSDKADVVELEELK